MFHRIRRTSTMARTLTWQFLTLLLGLLVVHNTRGDTVVVTNRRPETMRCELLTPGSAEGAPEIQQHRLEPLEVKAMAYRPGMSLRFIPAGQGQDGIELKLDPSSVYFFVDSAAGLVELHKLDLKLDGSPIRPSAHREPVTIPVYLLVDDEEPSTQKIWEPRVRRRLERASSLFERLVGVRFEPVDFGRWESPDTVTSLDASLRAFQQAVPVDRDKLAIGFTAQHREDIPGGHLGGIQGVLRSHILLREWSANMSEMEKLEVLVHELGHFLGAVHSPDPYSVMRSKLADRRVRGQGFPIDFDAVNVLLMNLVAEDLRMQNVDRVTGLTEPTRDRLSRIYEVIGMETGGEKSAGQMQRQVETHANPLVASTQHIVSRILAAAQSAPADTDPNALTEHYVRAAARGAADLPYELAPAAFLMGLGIAMDDSSILRDNPLTARFVSSVEDDQQRRDRIPMVGKPQLKGRRDLAQHFFVSVFLRASLGKFAAQSAGLAKEVQDAKGGSGFSYADLAADEAGIAWADAVLEGRIPVLKLAQSFTAEDFMPTVDDLPEGLKWEQWRDHYRLGGDETAYGQLRQRILERIEALPGYRDLSPGDLVD